MLYWGQYTHGVDKRATHYVNPSDTMVYGVLILGANFVLTVALFTGAWKIAPLLAVVLLAMPLPVALPTVPLLTTRLSGGQ